MIIEWTRTRVIVAVAAMGGLGLAFAAGSWVSAQSPAAPPAFKQDDPPNRALDANLYIQTSAEYRACCLQTYNLAGRRLKEEMDKKPQGKPAVVMDLDETVIDNAGYQASQIRSNLAFDQRLFTLWESDPKSQVGFVPGAKAFIDEAKKLGVTVVYISNRSDKYKTVCKDMLDRLGIGVTDDTQLKLNTSETSSDKTERRADTEKRYNVLLYIGDNLRDLDEEFKTGDLGKKTPAELEKAIAGRKAAVDKHAADFGGKWIILPNPAYGEWTKPLGMGKADLDRLAPVTAKGK